MTTFAPPMNHQLRWTISDGVTLIGRELDRLRQDPGQLIAMLIFPVIMVVLFGYVMDRFRSMPMARSAVPFGQTGADFLIGLPLLAVMVGAGLLVGWEPHRGFIPTAEAFLLMMLLRYALSWVGVYVGLRVKNDQIANALVPLFLPFTMLSNSFVPTEGMPAWLRVISDWNPVSAITAASRELFGNPSAAAQGAAWPLAHPITAVFLWSIVLLLIFVPLSIHAYHRKGR
ncbi:MAG: ABC transporter permease [Corynebacteriales bacterium]|nr:ABC transporter permease [Mycobacteriales bacterium]